MRSQTTVQNGAQQGTNSMKSLILWMSETEFGCVNMDMTYNILANLIFTFFGS